MEGVLEGTGKCRIYSSYLCSLVLKKYRKTLVLNGKSYSVMACFSLLFRRKRSSPCNQSTETEVDEGIKESKLETIDRLSDLPKHILDDILSRLPEEDVARTSILSKAWNNTWSTCPILRFSQHKYIYGVNKDPFHPNQIMPTVVLEKRNNFPKHVEKTLTRFHDQCLAIKEFKLHMQSFDFRIDHWMRLAIESGVQVLDLMMLDDRGPMHDGDDHCCLPPSILEAKSLIKLILTHAKFDHALVNNPIRFSSLQKLSLIFVIMRNEQIIQNIISSCPLIEYFSLISCSLEGQIGIGLKSVRIHGLRKLKSLVAVKIQEIDIDAPNLEYLNYAPPFITVSFKTNLDKCRNLRKLDLSYLRGIVINDQWFIDLFLKFPLLERLELEWCKLPEKLKISSVHLKVLKLADPSHSNMKEVNIDAPNLRSLRYHTPIMPTLSFSNSSSLLQVDLSLFSISDWDMLKLRHFLENFEHRSVLPSLSLKIYWPANEFNLDVLGYSSVPPPRIKHLKLWVAPQLHTCLLHLVTGLLCNCCPTAIFVRRDGTLSNSLIEAFCNVLNHGKFDECYCNSRDNKCWWYGLKDVQVTRTAGEVYDKIFIQLE